MRVRAMAAVVVALLVAPAAASAATYDDAAAVAAALHNGPVVIDSRATPPIGPADAARIVAEIRLRDPGRIRIAYVTSATVASGGGVRHFTNAVADADGGRGVTLVEANLDVYLVQSYDDGDPVEAVRGAFSRTENTQPPAAQLLEVVRALARVDPGPRFDSGGASGGAVGRPGSESSGGVSTALTIVLLVIAGAIVVLVGWFVGGRVLRAHRAEEASAEDLSDRRSAAKDALVALGDAITELDIDSQMPNADAAGKRSYDDAVAAYSRGEEELGHADSAAHLGRAEATIADGKAAIERARTAFRGG